SFTKSARTSEPVGTSPASTGAATRSSRSSWVRRSRSPSWRTRRRATTRFGAASSGSTRSPSSTARRPTFDRGRPQSSKLIQRGRSQGAAAFLFVLLIEFRQFVKAVLETAADVSFSPAALVGAGERAGDRIRTARLSGFDDRDRGLRHAARSEEDLSGVVGANPC